MTLHAKPFGDKNSPRVLSVYDDDKAICNLIPQCDDSERDWATLFALSLELVAMLETSAKVIADDNLRGDNADDLDAWASEWSFWRYQHIQVLLAKVPARFKQSHGSVNGG